MYQLDNQIIRESDNQKNKTAYPVICLSGYQNFSIGFTLIEILMVMGLLGVIGAITAPMLGSFVNQVDRQSAIGSTTALISQAHTFAVSKKNNTSWGICYQSNEIWLYRTTCTSTNVYNRYQLPQNTSVIGLSSIEFNASGELTTPQGFTLESNSKSTQISVSQMGAVNVE